MLINANDARKFEKVPWTCSIGEKIFVDEKIGVIEKIIKIKATFLFISLQIIKQKIKDDITHRDELNK